MFLLPDLGTLCMQCNIEMSTDWKKNEKETNLLHLIDDGVTKCAKSQASGQKNILDMFFLSWKIRMSCRIWV